MKDRLYEKCPACRGRGRTAVGGEPWRGTAGSARCGLCKGRGFLSLGITSKRIDALLITAAIHFELLRTLIVLDEDRSGSWTVSNRLSCVQERRFPTFDDAQQYLYDSILDPNR